MKTPAKLDVIKQKQKFLHQTVYVKEGNVLVPYILKPVLAEAYSLVPLKAGTHNQYTVGKIK